MRYLSSNRGPHGTGLYLKLGNFGPGFNRMSIIDPL